MPIIKVYKNGKTGYKYGKSGKVYFGRGAKKKAEKQMRAIYASKSRVVKKKK